MFSKINSLKSPERIRFLKLKFENEENTAKKRQRPSNL